MKTRRSTRLQTIQKSKGIKLLVAGATENDNDVVALKETDSINVCLEKGSSKKNRADQTDPTSDNINKNEAKTNVEKSNEEEMNCSSENNLEKSSPKKNREKDVKTSPKKSKENELKSSPEKTVMEDLESESSKRNEKKVKLKTEKNCEKELKPGKISGQTEINNQRNFEEDAVSSESLDKRDFLDSESAIDLLENSEKALSNDSSHSVKIQQSPRRIVKESPQKNLPTKERSEMSTRSNEGNLSKNRQKGETIESQGLNKSQSDQSTSQNETFSGDKREVDNSNCDDYTINSGRYSGKGTPTNEIDNNRSGNSNSESDDDCPIDMSLHESKLKILEQNQLQKEAVTAQQQRKRKVKNERDKTNKLRKEEIRRHKVFIPDKLDDEILRKIELNEDENGDDIQKTIKKKLVIPSPKKEVKNNKIIFSEGADIADEGFCDVDQKKSTVFQAKHIQNVQKSCTMNSAQEFLRNHFYGNRLDRIQLHSKFNEKRRTINVADNDIARKRKKNYKI